MDRAGVRGVRFNFVKRLVDFTPRDVLERIAARVAPLGWHIVIYFEMPDLPEFEDFFTSLPTTVVVDHMGTPDVKKGVDHPENQRFHRLMDRHKNFWVKVTCPERMSVAGPPYDDVVPFAKRLVERFPDRVIWGTDWPHPNMKKEAPDDGVLVDRIPHDRAPRRRCSKQLLVDNPMRLYWTLEFSLHLAVTRRGRHTPGANCQLRATAMAAILCDADDIRGSIGRRLRSSRAAVNGEGRWHARSRTMTTSRARSCSTPSARARATASTCSACR